MFIICQRMGLPPISTIGLGRKTVSSDRRVPAPPARITTFIFFTPSYVLRTLFLVLCRNEEQRAQNVPYGFRQRYNLTAVPPTFIAYWPPFFLSRSALFP